MTIAIGVQREGFVEFYTDSRVVGGSVVDVASKIFSAHGAIWAMSGDLSAKGIFCGLAGSNGYKRQRYNTVEGWFCGRLWPAWRAALEALDRTAELDLLASVNGELYEMSSAGSYATRPSRGYACVGSGAKHAYGAIEFARSARGSAAGVPYLDILRLVSRLDEQVGPPFIHSIARNQRLTRVEARES